MVIFNKIAVICTNELDFIEFVSRLDDSVKDGNRFFQISAFDDIIGRYFDEHIETKDAFKNKEYKMLLTCVELRLK